jgi:hypothetical protein
MRQRVFTAADKEPGGQDDPFRPKRQKYGPIEPRTEPKFPPLSSSDEKELARLVGKYSREAIAAALPNVAPRKAGRPSRGLLPYYERMHEADWIEEQADEHRKAGSRKPYADAEIDLYEMLYDGEETRPDFERWRRTLKKRRHRGRQELNEWRQHLQKHNQILGRK